MWIEIVIRCKLSKGKQGSQGTKEKVKQAAAMSNFSSSRTTCLVDGKPKLF
jgi:hypothetical protein